MWCGAEGGNLMATHFSSTVTTRTIDPTTGVILDSQEYSVTKTVKREEMYYMIIFHNYGRVIMEGLPRSCDYIIDMVISDCLPWMDDDPRGACTVVGARIFDEWASKSMGKYSSATLKRYFYMMLKKDVFRKVQRGMYMINPYFMFKGNLKYIENARERWNHLAPAGK